MCSSAFLDALERLTVVVAIELATFALLLGAWLEAAPRPARVPQVAVASSSATQDWLLTLRQREARGTVPMHFFAGFPPARPCPCCR